MRIDRTFLMLRGVAYSVGFIWLWTWIAMSVRALDSRIAASVPAWLAPVGLVIAAAGGLLAGLCIATFLVKGRGTPAPFDPPRDFVATGPYRYVRNPMYVGAGAVILGAGLLVSSPAIILLAPAFLGIMHIVVVLYEEPTLAHQFGDTYLRYRATVARWLIRRPRRVAASG